MSDADLPIEANRGYMADRAERMFYMRQLGMTYEDIGRKFNLSRDAVSATLRKRHELALAGWVK